MMFGVWFFQISDVRDDIYVFFLSCSLRKFWFEFSTFIKFIRAVIAPAFKIHYAGLLDGFPFTPSSLVGMWWCLWSPTRGFHFVYVEVPIGVPGGSFVFLIRFLGYSCRTSVAIWLHLFNFSFLLVHFTHYRDFSLKFSDGVSCTMAFTISSTIGSPCGSPAYLFLNQLIHRFFRS